jgi:hypothetical protein
MTTQDHKQALINLAKETGVTVTFFDDSTCVNGNDSRGSFICTANYCTLEENIIAVTNWIADLFYRNAELEKLMEEINTDYEASDIFYSYYDTSWLELEAEYEAMEEEVLLGGDYRHDCKLADPYMEDCYMDLKRENTLIHS